MVNIWATKLENGEWENEKMGSDKKGFLTGLTCRTNQTGQGFRKETEEIIKRLGGFLMKKGCKMGGVSL